MKKFLLLIILFFKTSTSFAATYVFVSFSMPDNALKSYFKEAQKHNAILVMRGLKDDSFQETQKKTLELKITYNIDPELFEKYEVSKVPVIVLDEGNIKKITGHISLTKALEILKEK